MNHSVLRNRLVLLPVAPYLLHLLACSKRTPIVPHDSMVNRLNPWFRGVPQWQQLIRIHIRYYVRKYIINYLKCHSHFLTSSTEFSNLAIKRLLFETNEHVDYPIYKGYTFSSNLRKERIIYCSNQLLIPVCLLNSRPCRKICFNLKLHRTASLGAEKVTLFR